VLMEQTDRQTDSPVLAVALSARLSRVTLLWNRQTDRQTDRQRLTSLGGAVGATEQSDTAVEAARLGNVDT